MFSIRVPYFRNFRCLSQCGSWRATTRRVFRLSVPSVFHLFTKYGKLFMYMYMYTDICIHIHTYIHTYIYICAHIYRHTNGIRVVLLASSAILITLALISIRCFPTRVTYRKFPFSGRPARGVCSSEMPPQQVKVSNNII